jgi:TusA-related sulfurtransferase
MTRLLVVFDDSAATNDIKQLITQLRGRLPDIEFIALTGVRQIVDIGPKREDSAE